MKEKELVIVEESLESIARELKEKNGKARIACPNFSKRGSTWCCP